MSLRKYLDNNWTLGPKRSQWLKNHFEDEAKRKLGVIERYQKVQRSNQRHIHGVSRSLPSVFTQQKERGIILEGHKAIVFLRRHSEGHLGVGIQGGQEFNLPVIVSVPGEQGQARGLCAGDRILTVNGTDFRNITHAEAVTIIQSAWNVLMLVEHQDSTDKKQLRYESKFCPPVFQELELYIYPSKNGMLGCGVNRDAKGNLNIVTVTKESPASRAGLLIDDCLVEVEGITVSSLTDHQVLALIQDVKRICVKIHRHKRQTQDKENHKDDNISLSNLHSREFPSDFQKRCSSTPRYYLENNSTSTQEKITPSQKKCSKSLFGNQS